ncbi:MAG: phosphotransferase [Pseudomonadota bacterium]
MNLAIGLDRMPHKGPMRLIDRIVAADETTIQCIAKDHQGADYPLRLSGALMTVSLVELGAQAAAAHVSLVAIDGHHTGLLLSLAAVEVLGETVHEDPERLQVEATRLAFGEQGAKYRFIVSAAERSILQGEAMMRMEEAPQ